LEEKGLGVALDGGSESDSDSESDNDDTDGNRGVLGRLMGRGTRERERPGIEVMDGMI
jgi:hypothetical protein